MPNKYYATKQGDTWDLISFKLFTSEWFADQLCNFNPTFNRNVVFDTNVKVLIPEVVSPVNVSNVVWGTVLRYG